MDELETLQGGQQVVLMVGGKTLAVRPLTIGQYPAFARAIRPLAPALDADEPDWLALVAEHGEALIEAASVATGIGRDDLGRLDPDEFIEIAAAILAVNMDFFVRRLAPAVKAAEGKILALSGAGLTPSKR